MSHLSLAKKREELNAMATMFASSEEQGAEAEELKAKNMALEAEVSS